MKVYKNLSIEIPGTNTHYFNLDEYSKESNVALYYGYNFLEKGVPQELINAHDYNVYLNVTMPTEFCQPQGLGRDNKFDKIYGICPYTNNWLNTLENNNRYETISYPFNEKDIPNNTKKKYDVIYHGGLHGNMYVTMLDIFQGFNYRYISQSYGINDLTKNNLHRATNINLSNNDKLKVIAQSKISVCFNTFPMRNNKDINNIKSKPNWQNCDAFKHIEDLNIAPQFKSRCNEAAFSRTLNLIKRDPWNVIEYFYEPDEFVYFDTMEELPYKIKEILNNWDNYIHIIEKAYIKSLNYSTKVLYNKIIEDYNEK